MPTKKANARVVDDSHRTWTFFTNHAHVLLCLAESHGSDVRVRDIAARVGITERAVQRILTELEDDGYITRARVGRQNVYVIHEDEPLRHPMKAHHPVRSLLALVRPALER